MVHVFCILHIHDACVLHLTYPWCMWSAFYISMVHVFCILHIHDACVLHLTYPWCMCSTSYISMMHVNYILHIHDACVLRSLHLWLLFIIKIIPSGWHCTERFFFFLKKIIMHQLIKLTDAIWLLQLAISSPLIHALGDPSQAPPRQGFKPMSPDWEADHLPIQLSLPPTILSELFR